MANSTTSEINGIHIAEYTLFATIFLFGVTGNTLVCLVIFQTPRMRTTRNYLLVNLAVSDLMVALLCIPFDVVLKVTAPVWPLGSVMCKVLWPGMTMFTNCSAATLAAISYDRYRAVIHPWKPRFTTTQTTIIICTTWLMSFFLVLPYILSLKIIDDYCKEEWPVAVAVKVYTMGLFVFQYGLPLVIIGFAYTMVVLKLRKQASRIAKNRQASGISEIAYKKARDATGRYMETEESEIPSNGASMISHKPSDRIALKECTTDNLPNSSNRKEEKRLERNTKIVKMLVAVVLLYAICLLPNQIVWLWMEFGTGSNWTHLNKLLTFGSVMVYVNSCVNPLLYAGMNENFRKGFARILRCQCTQPRSFH